MSIILPRFSPPVWIVFSAALLLLYVGLSWIPIFHIVLGSGIFLYAYWNEKRLIGIIGYLVLAFGTAATMNLLDVESISNIGRAGFLFVLPLCIFLWYTLTIGTYPDPRTKVYWLPYAVAFVFAALILTAVPIAALILRSASFATDTGETSQIMLIAFAAAVWSAVVLGVERKK